MIQLLLHHGSKLAWTGLTQDLTGLMQDLTGLIQDLTGLVQDSIELNGWLPLYVSFILSDFYLFFLIVFQSLNRAALDGPMRPFLEVPFPDGTSPTVDVCQSSSTLFLATDCMIKHNLPLLDSLEAAQTMHHTQLKSYHRHYCPMREGVNGWLERDTRIREVLKEIGYDH